MFIIKLLTKDWKHEHIVASCNSLEEARKIYKFTTIEDFNLTQFELSYINYVEKALFNEGEFIESEVILDKQ